MILAGPESDLFDIPVKTPTGQDWGLALLLSVQPTDRALAGHGFAGRLGDYLTRLARDSDDYVPGEDEEL